MNKSISDLAKELRKSFEFVKKEDREIWIYTENILDKNWKNDVILGVYEKIDRNNINEVIIEVLDILGDLDYRSEEEIKEKIYENLEPDLMTYQLTEWLNTDIRNVYYLTDAMERGDIEDGFQLLSEAQWLYKLEIAEVLIEELEKISKL